MDPNVLVDRTVLDILALALFGLFLTCFYLLERFLSYRGLYKEKKEKLDVLCKYLNEFSQNDALLAKLTPLAEEYRRACRAQIESVQQGGNLQTTAADFPEGDADEERVADGIAFRAEKHAERVRSSKDFFWSGVKIAQDAAGVLKAFNHSHEAPSFSRILNLKSYKEFLPENARASENE